MDLKKIELQVLNEPILKLISEEVQKEGLNLYLVGGALRDYFLDLRPRDFDFLFEGSREGLETFLRTLSRKLRASYFLLGKKDHMLYRMVIDQKVLDFTLLWEGSIEENLKRRDFTVNAIAYSLSQRRFYLHPDSLRDLEEKKLRLASPEAFLFDPLRILRAFRYMATLGFTVPFELKQKILKNAHMLSNVAPERILTELEEIFLSESPYEAIVEMADSKVMEALFPELSFLRGLEQGPFHTKDAFWHSVLVTVEVLKIAKDPTPLEPLYNKEDKLALAYSALFHDLGKRETLSTDSEGVHHFYGHEVASKEKALKIIERYPFSRGLSQKIVCLVENHMYVLNLSQSNPTDRAIRRFISRIGEELELALILAWAEWREKGKDEDAYRQFLSRVIALKRELKAFQPLIKGRDLLDLGFPPGPIIGQILQKVHELHLDGVLKTKEEAMEFVKQNFLTKGETWEKK